MSMGSVANEINCEMIVWFLKHAKCFTKTEVSHNIECQIVAPVSHVLRDTPSLLFDRIAVVRAQSLAKGADVVHDVLFHSLDSIIGEGLRKYSSLACMSSLVNAVVCIGGILGCREDGVELRFSNVAVEAIDLFQGGIAVDGQTVGSKSYELACQKCSAIVALLLEGT